jgi:hypothetical protein
MERERKPRPLKAAPENVPGRAEPSETPRRHPEDKVREQTRDPLGHESGAHALGTGAGAVIGGVAGATVGAVAGPLGAVVGAGFGILAGGVAGREIGGAVNPTEEEEFWRERFRARQHPERPFEAYEPAYRYGWEACVRHGGRSFDEVEDELGREWDSHRGRSDLGWMEARPAARDAWIRVQSRIHERGRTEGRIIT